jgi:ATP-dependent Clp protease ATP-binding subunit ClpC
VLELSLREALQLNHSYIGTEHILLGLVREGEGVAAQVLVNLGADLNRVRNQVLRLLSGFQGKEVATPGVPTQGVPTVLDQFGRNLTQAAAGNKLDPVIGRETEIERVMQVLSRRTKNNPVLVAEPGIDTSPVVEGLAQAIVRGEVPDTLDGIQIYRLDLRSLLNINAGTDSAAGETVSNVLKDLRSRRDIVCFIDQLHTIFVPGFAQGGVALASALKEMMASGNLRTIGGTTLDDYRMYIAKDDTLGHLFQSIEVKEPSIPHTIDILRGMRDRYEAYHRVTITDEALVAAATLADRYMSERFLPDSAIDVIDEAGSRLRVRRMTAPPDLREFDEKVAAVRLEKEAAIEDQDFERGAGPPPVA